MAKRHPDRGGKQAQRAVNNEQFLPKSWVRKDLALAERQAQIPDEVKRLKAQLATATRILAEHGAI